MGRAVIMAKTWEHMEEPFGEDDKAAFQKEFKLFDKTRSGTIPVGDMMTVLRGTGNNLSEEDFNALMAEADKDSTGSINFEQYLDIQGMLRKHAEHEVEETQQVIWAAFQACDLDGSGYITKEELGQALADGGDATDENSLNEMMKEADTDGDGKVNYVEFTRMM